jgi:hypothetical protein
MGYDVEIMGTQNPGFDVRGKKPGHILKVEVKSHACEANILLIPGTSSVAHIRENLAAGRLTLSPQILTELDGIAAATAAAKH